MVSGAHVAADRPEIWDKTLCSAVVRGRSNRDRSLTMSGPVAKLEEAHKLAMEAMENDTQILESGGSLLVASGDFKGAGEKSCC